MRSLTVLLSLGLVVSLGCGGEAKKTFSTGEAKPSTKGELAADAPAVKQARGGENDKAAPEKRQFAERKIIYTAHLSVIVDDLTTAEEALLGFVKRHDGLVASSAITGTAGTPRSGRWRVRIPPGRLQEFVRAVVGLGVPENNTLDSEDVTDQYYDLDASIKNYRAEEDALRKLMEKAGDKMENVVAVRRELAALREKIDRLEGQLRRLVNLTALTTVHITFREVKDYVPPEAPTFDNRISRTWANSVQALVEFGKGSVLFAVALGPWLPLLLVAVVPLWLLLRRRGKRIA